MAGHNVITLTMNPAIDLSAEVYEVAPYISCDVGRRDAIPGVAA